MQWKEFNFSCVYLEKDYDTVPRNKLNESLKFPNIKKYLLLVIIEMNKGNTEQIKEGTNLSKPINIAKGLRRDAAVNLYVEAAVISWKTHCGGMVIPVYNETLFSMSIADDQIALQQEAFDYESMLKKLCQEYKNC